MPDINSTRWRTVQLGGHRGPGETFRWNGIIWEVVSIVDRANGRTIAIVAPSADQNIGPLAASDETPIQDYGEYQQHTASPSPRVPNNPPPRTQGPTQAPPSSTAPRNTTSQTGSAADIPGAIAAYRPGPSATSAPAARTNLSATDALRDLATRALNGDEDASTQLLTMGLDPITVLKYLDDLASGTAGENHDQLILGREQIAQNLQLEQMRENQTARGAAQSATESITSGLSAALQAIGMAAPGLFLANAQDPAAIRDALLASLASGQGVYPTLERQDLIATAAQNPTDIIRLLFLAGGQAPPERRTGAFNIRSVLEQGTQAREGLARQIAATPRVTFEDLVARFMPPMPGAAKGAIVEMRRDSDGVYRAAGGAHVVKGPTIFTVGEKGTEYALLAPGSVIAPKTHKGEADTMSQAMKAIAEMVLFGGRLSKSGKVANAKARATSMPRADLGAVSEAELPLVTLESILTGAKAAGAALSDPGRSSSERIRDMKLQLFPFPGVSQEERQKILENSATWSPAERQALLIGMSDQARNPTPYALEKIAERRRRLEGMYNYGKQQGWSQPLLDNIQRQLDELNTTDPNAALRLIGTESDAQALQGIQESFREGGGVPGNALPFADIEKLPEGARAAEITALGSLYGSDVVTNLLSSIRESRRQAFAGSESRLFVGR